MAARYWVGGTADWNATAGTKWSLTSGGAGGEAVPTASDDVFIDANSGTNTVTITAPAVFKTLDGTGSTATLAGSSTLTANGNITRGGLTLSYTGALIINSNLTIDSNTGVWGMLNSSANATITLTSDLIIGGNYNTSNTLTYNGSNLRLRGADFRFGGGANISGTTNIIVDGTIDQQYSDSSGVVNNNFEINKSSGTLIIQSVLYGTGTFLHTLGAVNCTGTFQVSIASAATSTINAPNILFNNFTFAVNTFTVVLLGNLNVNGILFVGTGTKTFSGAYLVSAKGNISLQNGNLASTAGATMEINGGNNQVWNSNGANIGAIQMNLTINKSGGYLILNNTIYYNTGTLTYTKGNIITNSLSNLVTTVSSTLINMHKINFNQVTVTNGITLTMNEFFCGRPEVKTKVVSSSSTANFTVTFTNGVPKKAFNVSVTGATITSRNQLNVINRNGNGGRNQGIIFGEIGRNGFPINMFPTEMTYSTENGFLTSMNN